MAWTGLTFSVGQILTAAQMNNLQGNFAAVAAGDSGAPEILNASFKDPATGAVECWKHPGFSTSDTSYPTADYHLGVGARIYATGTIKITLSHYRQVSGSSFARVLVNGVQNDQWSTTSETPVERTKDIAINYGDIITFEHLATTGTSQLVDPTISADNIVWANSQGGM